MKCDCCGKPKKLFDMFYTLKNDRGTVHLCAECNQLPERVRLDALGGERELFALHLEQWKRRAKAPSPEFAGWQQAFLAPYREKLGSPE